MIPDSFKQELLHRVDIVDVIERYVPLKKGGANFVACCPFHSEKTPSFTVSPAKQFYHCFGCGVNGNAISFLMEYQGLGYVDAVKDLAESAGMKLPEFEPAGERAGKKPAAGPDLHEIMRRASDYYREQLKAAPRAIDYLKHRGLTGKIAARFGIGYAPEGWNNLERVFPDYADKALKEAGLVIDGEAGRRYDRFRDRIMFPILDQRGSVIAFGGRILDGEPGRDPAKEDTPGPKYLNSPETPLFEKGRELYGLAQARHAIRTAGRVVVVEGYMDVVALAQHEIDYAVATLGTATSATHVQKLLRQSEDVVFCFDGDAAGRKAAWHALEVSLPHLADHKAIRFLFLPAEHDPDSFVRERGREAFEKALAEARPLSEFFLDELRGRVSLQTVEGRARLIHEAKPLVQKIQAPNLRIQLLKQLSYVAGLSPEEANRLFQQPREKRENPAVPARPLGQRRAPNLLRPVRHALLVSPALADNPVENLLGEDFESRSVKELAACCRVYAGNTLGALVDHFRGTEFAGSMSEALMDYFLYEFTEDQARIEFDGALQKLEIRRVEEQLRSLIDKAERGQATAADASAIKDLIAKRESLRPVEPNRQTML